MDDICQSVSSRSCSTESLARFGVNLRQAREKLGLSQEALGDLCGLHRTEISLLERACREPRLTTIVKLAGSLEATPTQLLDGISWDPSSRQLAVEPLGDRD